MHDKNIRFIFPFLCVSLMSLRTSLQNYFERVATSHVHHCRPLRVSGSLRHTSDSPRDMNRALFQPILKMVASESESASVPSRINLCTKGRRWRRAHGSPPAREPSPQGPAVLGGLAEEQQLAPTVAAADLQLEALSLASVALVEASTQLQAARKNSPREQCGAEPGRL